MINETSIIVLTPIKNETWILDRFLAVTSIFADLVILLDQSDGNDAEQTSKLFEKAIYLRNESNEYDEEYRQKVLIEKARELVPGRKLLLALDVDEIITYESINSEEWQIICSQSPGTTIFFSKPDILPSMKVYINHQEPFLLGYLDDGQMHRGTKFHSPRLPLGAEKYLSRSIVFIHFALVREKEYYARQRLYAVMENLKGTSPLRLRIRKYSRKIQALRNQDKLQTVPEGWLMRYREAGVDVESFHTSEDNSYNRQILTIFREVPSRRFWFDDIWYVDYNEIANEIGVDKHIRIQEPPVFLGLMRRFFIQLYAKLLVITGKIK